MDLQPLLQPSSRHQTRRRASTVRRSAPVRILTICLGNICRSPMAGGLLRERLRREGRLGEVRTAGLSDHSGRPPVNHAVQAMREIGIDIGDDYSKPLTAALVDWADVIVPAEEWHAHQVFSRHPEAAPKLRRLAHDITDPYGRDLDVYRKTRDHLRQLIDGLALE